MNTGLVLSFSAVALLALPSIASATTVTIAGDSGAALGNFQTPGATAQVGYTITTSDNGNAVVVTLSTTDPSALPFANLYFDTVANNGMGSDLGFEASATAVNDAFDPDTGVKYSTAYAGFSSAETNAGGTETLTVTIPNAFFLTDPDGIGFAVTPVGTDVSLHLSQSFSYSVVGGSGNFPAPTELGLATVNASPVPEPASLTYMALSGLGLLGEAGRRLRGRKRA